MPQNFVILFVTMTIKAVLILRSVAAMPAVVAKLLHPALVLRALHRGYGFCNAAR